MDHVIDPALPQGAGHDHNHDRRDSFKPRNSADVLPQGVGHDHGHDHGPNLSDYYIEQLLTIFICGAFGIVAILMYYLDMLKFLLAPAFYDFVLIGGIGLLVVTLLRGISLWTSVGSEQVHDHAHHDHKPGEVCDDPTHAHDDDHSAEDHAHGNIYWRMVVLVFPIVLFTMGLPNKTFSKDYIEAKLGKDSALGELRDVAERTGEATYDFTSLGIASANEDKRRSLEGTPARIKGQLRHIPGSPDEFGLFYLKITCCTTDAVPLKARIKVDRPSLADSFKRLFPANAKDHQWVEVSGTIQFARLQSGEYITVLRVKDGNGIIATEPVY